MYATVYMYVHIPHYLTHTHTHTVLFEIELLGFVDYSAAEDIDEMRSEEQRNVSFQQRLAAANSEREVGNDFFQQNMIGRAIGKYLKVYILYV